MTDQVERLSESWDAHAQEWIDWVRAPGRQDSYWRFHRKRFLALVPRAGTLTVDIGCGEGRVGRDLQKLGHKVLGVDLSPTMCQAAATHPEPQPVVRADAGRLPLPEGSADCAIAFMSLQDIDDMPGAFKEMARVLEDDCPLVLAIVHPMYSGGKFSKGKFSRTSKSSNLFVIKRSYFQPKRLVSTDVHGSLRVTLFREHRPLQVYAQALFDAGFNIERLLELTDEDQARNRDGIPLFLDIVARRRPREKPAGSAQQFDVNDFDTEYPLYKWLVRASLDRILSVPKVSLVRGTERRVDVLARRKPREKQVDSAREFDSEDSVDAKLRRLLDREYSDAEMQPVSQWGRVPLPAGGPVHNAAWRSIPVVSGIIVIGLTWLIATALLNGFHP